MNKQLKVLILIFLVSLLGCVQKKNTVINIENIELFQEKIEYPYKASEKRKMLILNNMNKLKKGMTKKEVLNLMNQPDKANLTYKFKKVKSDNVIGFSLVYILRQDVGLGSTLKKNEQLLRIHFDNSEKLLWSYAVGVNEFKPIKKE